MGSGCTPCLMHPTRCVKNPPYALHQTAAIEFAAMLPRFCLPPASTRRVPLEQLCIVKLHKLALLPLKQAKGNGSPGESHQPARRTAPGLRTKTLSE